MRRRRALSSLFVTSVAALLASQTWTWTKAVAFLSETRSLVRRTRPSDGKETQLAATSTPARTTEANNNAKKNHPIGVYVHIPFCRRRCRYCNFAIVPIGSNRSLEDDDDDSATPATSMVLNYTDAILREIRQQQLYDADNFDVTNNNRRRAIRSIYFGGGTPSLAPVSMLRSVLDCLRAAFPCQSAADVEISIEMDPGTFSLEKLRAVKELGFNRISLGVQSFDDDILESLGRCHRAADVYSAVSMLKEVYGSTLNFSVDLISGLPGLTLAKWSETLAKAVQLDPPPQHLSLYDLQIEQGTVFGSWYGTEDGDDKGRHIRRKSSSYRATRGEPPLAASHRPLPSDEESAFMYKYASGYLRARGYEHYEVSSYALRTFDASNNRNNSSARKLSSKSPYRSRHNQIYWAYDGEWFAFGLGATSFVGGRLQSRPRTLYDYQKWVASDMTRYADDSDATAELDFLEDIVLKRLRTTDGLSLTWVASRFGDAYVDAILRGAQLGLEFGFAVLEDGDPTRVLRLTDPDGLLLSNSILSSIFVELDEVARHSSC